MKKIITLGELVGLMMPDGSIRDITINAPHPSGYGLTVTAATPPDRPPRYATADGTDPIYIHPFTD